MRANAKAVRRRRASPQNSPSRMSVLDTVPETYPALLADLKQRIRDARLRASLSVNRELVLLYWSIGREIANRQQKEGWGTKVIDRLAADLRKAFPEMTGFSARNLGYMRSCAEAWPDKPILQQVAAKLPWGHIMVLIDAVKSPIERDWYARQAIEHGWSRNVMAHQIDGALFNRQGGALTNFDRTLPAEQSELAQQLIKDPYNFEFLSLSTEAKERAIEQGMIQQDELGVSVQTINEIVRRRRAQGGPTMNANINAELAAVVERWRKRARTFIAEADRPVSAGDPLDRNSTNAGMGGGQSVCLC